MTETLMNQWFSNAVSAYNRFKLLPEDRPVNLEYAEALIEFEKSLETDLLALLRFEEKSSTFPIIQRMYDKIQFSKDFNPILRLRELYKYSVGRSSVSLALDPSLSIAIGPPTTQEQAQLFALGMICVETVAGLGAYLEDQYGEFDQRGEAERQLFPITAQAFRNYKEVTQTGAVDFGYAVALFTLENTLESEMEAYAAFEKEDPSDSEVYQLLETMQTKIREVVLLARMRELYNARLSLVSDMIAKFKELLVKTLGLVQQVRVMVDDKTTLEDATLDLEREARKFDGLLTKDVFSESVFVEFVGKVTAFFVAVNDLLENLYYRQPINAMRSLSYYENNIRLVHNRRPKLIEAEQAAEFAFNKFRAFQEKTGYVIL